MNTIKTIVLASFVFLCLIGATWNIATKAEGEFISSFDTNASGNTNPFGLGTDGANIWVADRNGAEVYKYQMDGTYISSFDTAACGNTDPFGLGTDGTNIWVTDDIGDEVYKYEMDGTYISSFDTAACGNTDPFGLGTDGTNIWVTDWSAGEVYKYEMDGTYIRSFDTNAGNTLPYGLGNDGTNIWVADDDNNEVYKYEGAPATSDTFDITVTGESLYINITNTTWAIGTIAMSTIHYTNETGITFIADMEDSTVNTDLKLQITNAATNWVATVATEEAGADVYRLNASIDLWVSENMVILGNPVSISSDITLGDNETFDMRFDAPTSTTVGTVQSITVTASIIKH